MRDACRRSRLTAIYMFCLACTSLFRNMKLNAIAQSGSPSNVYYIRLVIIIVSRDTIGMRMGLSAWRDDSNSNK